ncbi:hypothetical protein SAOR_03735 [Salinisphaera orenii MK-B5]|uniref:DUF883 domain-containing protein n=2 Tax=Salinisphaera orenii TaxID=856731 RepID=A0A423PU82_9GAMM|nr:MULTISPECIES: hypothetical protein [Salinisphaera]ROO29180.1 hypothetical protein SAOR_03735 [Salinisphaera orenii MK-B5]ROO30705.1 hypothetical protein SAHL_07830 [Salinisphaera halophila YIM 95161]
MSQNPESEALRKDIDQLKRDLSALAETYKRSSEQRAQAGIDSARGKYDELKREANRQTQDLGSEIESRPFTSVLAAFGIGLVLGKLIGR